MICPHCQKIIAEGGKSCPFCGMQFSAPPQGQAQAGAGVPQGQYAPQQANASYPQGQYAPQQVNMPYPQGQYAPQQAYAPYPPPSLTPAQKYQTLGGFLHFVTVIWHYILPIFSALAVLSYGIQGVKLITEIGADNYTFEALKPALRIFWLCVTLVVEAVFNGIVAAKIERRDSGFLRLWQIVSLIKICFSVTQQIVFGSALSAVLVGGSRLVSFAVWHIYFATSLRVRIYMGSEDYLHKALFHKGLLHLKPNVDKSTKNKNSLIAAALILIWFVIVGINASYTLKPVIQQLRTQTEAAQQARVSEYTDELTGATFTIPKGLKETTQFADSRYSLVLESAHDNFEFCAFASHDMFEEMDEADKQNMNRAQMNNEMFTRKEIEDWLTEDAGETVSDTKTTVERIGKYEYYVVSSRQTDESGNTGEIVNFVHYYNGYEYVFHYETYFKRFSMDAVKEWIASTTIPGEAALPEVQKK